MTRAAIPLLLVLAACTARTLREAQDHFNRGAEIENTSRAASTAALLASTGAEAEYRAALAGLNAELKDHSEDLEAEGLYPTARLLKALCLWRLAALSGGGLEAARAELKDVAPLKDKLGTRDRVLLAALPGLLDHEKGLREKDVAKAAADFESAEKAIAAALAAEAPPAAHDVTLYLRLAQMAALRERIRAINASALPAPEKDAAKDKARERFAAPKNALKEVVDTDPAYAGLRALGVTLSQAASVTW